MANVDKPNGFRPVKTMSGAPISSMIRTCGVADGADIFVGDAINIESGLAAVGATGDEGFAGVAVGFGKFDEGGLTPQGPYNPDSLTTRYYDDSASTHTEWVCYYVPVNDVIFEAQTAADLDLTVGGVCDYAAGTGNTTTGISGAEIATSSNNDLIVVELPTIPGNDPTLTNARVYVKFLTNYDRTAARANYDV
jgi:hypothetical protein